MAVYKSATHLTQSNHEAFDQEHGPGSAAPYSAIYRCGGCGKEVASNQNQPLPPQNHHQHSANQGRVRWKMVVCAQH